MRESSPKFSFIIPTYNRSNDLRNLLSDLDKLLTSENFEVVILNDGRDQATEQLCKIKRDYPIKYLFSEQRVNSSVSRNFCLREVQGEWVIFLDDDVRIKEDFLKQVEDALKKYPAFSFRLELPNRKTKPSLLSTLLERFLPGKILPLFGHFVGGFDREFRQAVAVDHLPGANMIFRVNLLRNIFFDEKIGEGTGYLDDADFSYTIKKKQGVKLWYLPFYSIVHLQTPSGGNRQLDRIEWFYYYQNHKFVFFGKHFSSSYKPFIIFFNFIETLLRSFAYRKNLIFVFSKALKNA